MSQIIVVFAHAVDCAEFEGRELSLDEAMTLLDPNDWMSSSRSGWFQSVLAAVLDRYAGFDELAYMTKPVAIVPHRELATKRQVIQRLIATIRDDTEPFVQATSWYGATSEDVRQHIAEAEVLRSVSDGCKFAFDNFFSFLASHAAALEDVEKQGKCLLHVEAGW